MSVTPDASRHDPVAPAVPRRLTYTLDEVGQLLGGISRRSVYRRIEEDGITSFLIGGTRVIAHDDLVAYVERRRGGAA